MSGSLTASPEWQALRAHWRSLYGTTLKQLFADDAQRGDRLVVEGAGLYLDYSKNLVTDETLRLLQELARARGVEQRRDAMFRGDKINETEKRAVLHVALRAPRGEKFFVDGKDVVPEVHEVLDRMAAFSDKVRSGEWRGHTGKAIRNVISIGIGGSDLGPVMVYEALKPYADGPAVRFISNIDPTDAYEKTKDLDPTTTLFIVASKTFTTLETMTNARMARDWFLSSLQDAGVTDGSDEANRAAIGKHFVAVSTALDLVADFGIDPENAFGFWNWVGGRYSVDSAVGTAVVVAIGPDNFADFLAGFHTIDRHFAETPWAENVPALMGLLNVWYVNFFKAGSHAVLPYAQ